MNLFETSLPLRLDHEAMLAYLALPPAGGVFLLVMEHKSDYVRYVGISLRCWLCPGKEKNSVQNDWLACLHARFSMRRWSLRSDDRYEVLKHS